MFLKFICKSSNSRRSKIWQHEKWSHRLGYVPKTIYEEIIEIMTQLVIAVIINKIKTAKNYFTVVDSRADVSHVDQLFLCAI